MMVSTLIYIRVACGVSNEAARKTPTLRSTNRLVVFLSGRRKGSERTTHIEMPHFKCCVQRVELLRFWSTIFSCCGLVYVGVDRAQRRPNIYTIFSLLLAWIEGAANATNKQKISAHRACGRFFARGNKSQASQRGYDGEMCVCVCNRWPTFIYYVPHSEQTCRVFFVFVSITRRLTYINVALWHLCAASTAPTA